LHESRKYRKFSGMARGDEVDLEVSRLFDNLVGPGLYYELERHFWLELWRVPVFEAVEDQGIEMRHYGPIRAFAYPHGPRLSLFNLLLGADRLGAVEGGHLVEALEWTESLGLDCRVPVRGARRELGEAEAAEDLLDGRGYRRTGTLATFARAVAPAEFPVPPGIEVEEVLEDSMAETFSNALATPYGLEWTGEGFFIGLPGRRGWRTYVAADREGPLAAAAMMMHHEAPQLAFAGTVEECRGRGAHMALLHRQIEDACATRGASQLFAFTEESLECPESLSPGARNLLRAGFRLVETRSVWQPPEELIANPNEAT
jgi:hypothetical protein